MKRLLYSCCVVLAGVSVSVFSFELLCTTAWEVLHLAGHLVGAARRAVAVWLFESLSLLFLLICLFSQLRRCLIEVIGPKSLLLFLFLLIRLLLQLRRRLIEVTGLEVSLLSNVYMALLFDSAFFAVVV